MTEPQRTATDERARPAGQVDLDDGVVGSSPIVFSQLLRSASTTAGLQVVSGFAGFLTALLLARFLGLEAYGRYALSFTWAWSLALLATIGADRFLVRGIAVYEVQGKWHLMKGLLKRTYQLVLLTSMTLAIAGCIVAVAWLSPSLRGPFCVAMLLVPLTALTLLRQGAMQAFGRVVTGQVPEYLIRPLLILAGIVALEFLGDDILTPATALGVNVLGVATAFCVGTVLLLRTLPTDLRLVRPEYATREWIRASIPMMLITGVWMLDNYVGTLVTGALEGPGAAGVFTVVQSSAAVIMLFVAAANLPLAPAVARLHARGDRQQLERTTQRIAWAGLLVSAPLCIAFAIFPDVFLDLFGPGFRTGSTALTIVALGQLVNAATGPAGYVLIMTGHELVTVRAVGVAVLINLVLAILLVPPLGVTGTAIAFVASLVLWNISLVLIARRRLGVNVTAFRRLSGAQPTQRT
jgi:O-antigen/teichoic acid export membrane protein